MAAPKGNQFWRQRSKHGRDKIFETPEDLWNAAVEYFQWCEQNPIIEGGWGKSKREILRAFTITGLCYYLDCNSQYLKTFKAQLNPEGKDAEGFNTVITRIEEVIYTQKFEGAAAGIFNHNIIARDLGLKDAQDITTGGDKLTKLNMAMLPLNTVKELEAVLSKYANS